MLRPNIRSFELLCIVRFCSSSTYAKKLLKAYKFPEIREDDCEQQNIRGSGPGGSCVNAAGNAVQLRHKATNCVVKVNLNELLTKLTSIDSLLI